MLPSYTWENTSATKVVERRLETTPQGTEANRAQTEVSPGEFCFISLLTFSTNHLQFVLWFYKFLMVNGSTKSFRERELLVFVKLRINKHHFINEHSIKFVHEHWSKGQILQAFQKFGTICATLNFVSLKLIITFIFLHVPLALQRNNFSFCTLVDLSVWMRIPFSY